MKVFLSSDMEGTAGVVDWQQCVGDGPEAAAGRRLLLAEVNAAIEGAVSGGATEIVVNDSHSTMRDLPADALGGTALPGRRPARRVPQFLRGHPAHPHDRRSGLTSREPKGAR
jgi:D-aminopeptidase